MSAEARLRDLVTPGSRVAVGDGMGAPRSVSAELSAAAGEAGGVRLVLGWLPTPDPGLDFAKFADVAALMSGWGVRSAMRAGDVRGVPVRWSAVPALLHGPMRPDVLVSTVVRTADGGYAFGTEVSWMQAAVASGAVVAGVLTHRAPHCAAGPALPAGQVRIVGETDAAVPPISFTSPGDVHHAIAEHVVARVPAGARVQVGPGALGGAIISALACPVAVDSGMLPDGVVDLDRRGLLLGAPVGTYLAGGAELLDWADGRGVLHPIEHSHDPSRLSRGAPLIAVNTALEIDDQAQINVESSATSIVAGIGGHPDYCAAGARSVGGLSVIALPAAHRGRPTLVDRLSGPVTTPGHDVDIVVTEHGAVDLRGLDRAGRARAIRRLWDRS
ncbi:acetyl-CoA hydrolase/transferase C-terminal domain-containing protein [Tomitella biformata]|uniref:acetyl-CoA hydrolase/transferase C-terminal domain-containing protein n=1 Tax=Tomitella biformata TaxID=630403 RepID=UPI000467A8E4|nr:acetyl-CoA hydrolase/transferase C-terminal domain-containing protein [Tomitella biformata]